jgi:KaiC/GvpD/RAD55 family RecA-like ATPase
MSKTVIPILPVGKSKDSFDHLGNEFQLRLIKLIIDNKDDFLHDIPYIKQNAFTDPIHKQIVGFIKDFHFKNGYIPSFELMYSLIGDFVPDDLMLLEVRETLNLLKEYTTEGQDEIKRNAVKFFKEKELIRFFNEQLQKIETGLDVTQSDLTFQLQKILDIGEHDHQTFGVYDNFEEIFSADNIVHIPVGDPQIDDYLQGGMIKGNLVLIAAGSGVGKTSITTALAQSAATNDFKVLQILFEDRKIAIQRKHMGAITEIEAKDLTHEKYTKIASQKAMEYGQKEQIRNNIKCKIFKNGELTPEKLHAEIQLEINKGFKPDEIIIDYFECMANPLSKTTDAWKLEAEKMRKIENFTKDFGALVIVTTQGTKASTEGMLLRLENISGSASKFQIGHMVMTINRTPADVESHVAHLFIPKNREGSSGRVFTITLNNGMPKIKVDKTEDGVFELMERQKEENYKQSILNTYTHNVL